MKKFFKENLLNILLSFYSLLNALMFLAMRVNYAGISKQLGADSIGLDETINPTNIKSFFIMYLPVIVCIIMFLFFIYTFILLVTKTKKKGFYISTFIVNIVFTILIAIIIALGSWDYIGFIIPKFLRSLIVSLIIIFFALILFFPIEGKRSVITKVAILLITIVLTIIYGYDLRFEYLTYDSVVYAVEDDYQIVYSTSDNSIAWITVGDTDYYDTYAGSMKSKDLVHKIVVPQSALDNAKSYTIHAKQFIYRGPFGAFYGKEIEKTHKFVPVDISDGIQYYSLSDVHESRLAAINAATKAGAIDFLVFVGDMSSDVEGEAYANYTNSLASAITNGEYPVVYARGNHECKGDYSEDLYKYVGSKDQKFYYEYTLASGAIHGIVLDMGEDHDPLEEEWWEYYGTDQFDSYRNEQTEFLEDQIVKENANKLLNTVTQNRKYNMVVCHIPICFVNHREDHEDIKNKWTELLNELDIDCALYGHQHELVPYEVGKVTRVKGDGLVYNENWNGYDNKGGDKYSKKAKEYLTDFEFTGFMVGRSADNQFDTEATAHSNGYTGLYINVDIKTKTQTASYRNSKGEIVKTMNPWTDEEAKEYWVSTINSHKIELFN